MDFSALSILGFTFHKQTFYVDLFNTLSYKLT